MPGVAKPAALRLLTGRRDGQDSGGRKVAAPPPFIREPPKPPTWLCLEARAEWRRVAPGMTRLDLLKPEDRAAFAAYCECWAQFVQATKAIQADGLTMAGAMGGLVAHPAVAIARNAQRELRSWCVQFGLTPVSEGSLSKGKAVEDDGAGVFD